MICTSIMLAVDAIERISSPLPSLLALAPALLLLTVILAPGAAAARPFQWDLPLGFPVPRVPEDNPMSWEKVALGRFLFYDTRMSGNETYSCSSCHEQSMAFTDGLDRAVGSTGDRTPRGSMNLTNVAYQSTLTWANPIVTTFETQALTPMFGDAPIELGLRDEEQLVERLRADARYQRMFREAFPGEDDPFTRGNVVKSLGAFERTLISGNSPFDRYSFGIDDQALSPSAIRGFDLFQSETLECFHCHGGFNFSASEDHQGTVFTDVVFNNTGLYNVAGPCEGNYPATNTGVYEHSTDCMDMGTFKPPTLRNIAVTAPYMHDGSVATLEEVIDHYAAGGRTIEDGPNAGIGSTNPYKSAFVSGFRITEQQKQDVIAFLESLTDEEFLTNPKLSDPFLATCPGDCGYDGAVSVDEVVDTVGVALGGTLATCVPADADADGDVTVTEVVRAVDAALHGCP